MQMFVHYFFFFKQKTAYEMRISDWSSDVCSSDLYFRQHYGGVDFFVLDGRYHRDPIVKPDDANKTMLGAAQKAWLKRELKASTTPFKVLAIGGGWSCAENEEGGDSWGVYLTERTELFDFIRDEGIGGVVCISGDSHMGELNCIRSEEHTSELQSLMRISYAVFCLQKKTNTSKRQ